MNYRGRFAPSPTGPLHFGSLVAALASYLDARAHQGQWLVRIEDLDPLRESPGATDSILASLEAHGLYWDEGIRFQSQRHDAYESVLAQWQEQDRIYPCACSRKELQANSGHHPRNCRDSPDWNQPPPFALRFRTHAHQGVWQDRLLGHQNYQIQGEADDFIVRRKEGYYAYHLAVVVDDIDQGINAIVRGQDLLDLTPFHRLLYESLEAPAPSYLHVPLVYNHSGQKLSKQTGAPALDASQASANIAHAMTALNHRLPGSLTGAPVHDQLAWGIENWHIPALGEQ
jgi:glutamyl-Q tRNA(Asp) synthetase